MIIDTIESMDRLKAFFLNSSLYTLPNNTLEIPELIKIDTSNSSSDFQAPLVINNDYIETINFPNLVQSPYIFKGQNLKNVDLSSLTQIEFGQESIINSYDTLLLSILQDTKIQTLDLPNFKGTRSEVPSSGTTINDARAQRASFRNNYWLKTVTMGNKFLKESENTNYKFNGFWFRNNYSLVALILNYPYVIPIDRTEGFSTTPILEGNGFIYVPTEELVTAYTESWGSRFTNKFKLISAYNNDILAYNDKITESWSQIIANCANGTYTKYNVGDTKTLYWNGIPMQMVIIAKGTDTVHDIKEDGSPAALTWMLKNISIFKRESFSTDFGDSGANFKNADGTSTYPGYRRLFTETILNGLSTSATEKDTIIQDGIKSVRKYSAGNETTTTWSNSILSIENIWPLSLSEMNLRSYTNPYAYFNDSLNPNRPNYFLGLSTLTSDENNGRITIGTRDYSSNSSYPNLIRSKSKNEKMEVVTGDSTNSYLIFCFCT